MTKAAPEWGGGWGRTYSLTKKTHNASTGIANSCVIVLSSLKEESEVMDLLVIGGITFDYLFWVDRLPEKHFEGVIKRHGRFFGGRAPNVAVAAAKLGIKTGLVSSVGDGFASEGYEAYLRATDVDLRGIVKVPRKNQSRFSYSQILRAIKSHFLTTELSSILET